LINQREVGGHTKSYANALKAALREDPDIILVGEMRDLETIQLALTAAETGHLVFGTLHTNNAHKTIDRIIDVFPENKQAQIRVMLSESLRGVVAQSLLPRADGSGRAAAYEVLVNTKAVGSLIRDGKTFQIPSTMQTARHAGMITFDASVEALIAKNLITKQVGMEFLGKAMPAAATMGSGAQPGSDSAQPLNQNQSPLQNQGQGVSQATMTGIPMQPGIPTMPNQPPSGLAAIANRFKKTS
jgi:twitching motility protein PilT